jgi:hypothetical protein
MNSEKANKNKVHHKSKQKLQHCGYRSKGLVVTETVWKSGMIALRGRANNDLGKDFSLPQDTPYLASFRPGELQRLQALATMGAKAIWIRIFILRCSARFLLLPESQRTSFIQPR